MKDCKKGVYFALRMAFLSAPASPFLAFVSTLPSLCTFVTSLAIQLSLLRLQICVD